MCLFKKHTVDAAKKWWADLAGFAATERNKLAFGLRLLMSSATLFTVRLS